MDIDELSRVIPHHFTDWDNISVLIWLEYIHLPHLVTPFERQHVEGSDLPFLTEMDLEYRLSVVSAIQRKKLMNWIDYLVQNANMYRRLLNSQQSLRFTRSFIDENGEEEASEDNDTMLHSFYERQTQEKCRSRSKSKELLCSTQKESFSWKHKTLLIYPKFGQQTKFYSCCGGKNLIIGKEATNSIAVADDRLQLKHCQIVHRKREHFIVPASTKAEVWVKIKKRIKIVRGCNIEMGFTQFQVTSVRGYLSLRVVEGVKPIAKSIFGYDGYQKKVVTVGRSSKKDLSFPFDATMSLFHGQFLYFQDSWYFQDLITTNGSWLKISQDVLVQDKMTFRCGKAYFFFDCRLVDEEDGKSMSSVSSLGICKKCKVEDKNAIVSPCSHNSCCYGCALKSNTCHQCGSKVSLVEKFFRA